MLQTKEEIKVWLDSMGVKDYTINDDLTVDVNGDANLNQKKLTEVPIQFGNINGYFSIWNNRLVSLKGCPIKVNGSFDCSHNKLKSLEYCPKDVSGNFVLYANPISEVIDVPNSIGNLNLYENDLSDIDAFRNKINEYLSHECSLPQYRLKDFLDLYEYRSESYYKYCLILSAQQVNAFLLQKDLNLELLQKNNKSINKKTKI